MYAVEEIRCMYGKAIKIILYSVIFSVKNGSIECDSSSKEVVSLHCLLTQESIPTRDRERKKEREIERERERVSLQITNAQD